MARLYVQQGMTLRDVAAMAKRSHHVVRLALLGQGVAIRSRSERFRGRTVTDAARANMSAAAKRTFQNGRVTWSKGMVCSPEKRLRMMAARMCSSLDFSRYIDTGRLRFLLHYVTKRRSLAQGDAGRKAFLDAFYDDEAFVAVYVQWLIRGKCKWSRPSLDHIVPISAGGTWHLDNLRFITWFENRAKADMTQDAWLAFRASTGTVSSLFIENIVAAARTGRRSISIERDRTTTPRASSACATRWLAWRRSRRVGGRASQCPLRRANFGLTEKQPGPWQAKY